MPWLIYKHTNKINGKVYIGLTKSRNPQIRWGRDGNGYKKDQPVFHSAIIKYGWNNFYHEVIEKDIATLELANKREQYWIKQYNSYIKSPNSNGYNMTIGGGSPNTGNLWTEKEEDLIIKYYPLGRDMCYNKLLEFWGFKKRSMKSIYSKAYVLLGHRTPIKTKNITLKAWSHEEMKLLKNAYIKHDRNYCYKLFPHRTQKSVDRKIEALKIIKHNLVSLHTTGKKIRCIETQKEYNSIREARSITGITTIASYLTGRCKIAGGYHWEYVN